MTNQILESFMQSPHIVFAEAPCSESGSPTVLRKHMQVDDRVCDQEVRHRIKNLEEGTSPGSSSTARPSIRSSGTTASTNNPDQ